AALEGIGIDGIENITVTTDGDVLAGDTAIRIDQSGGTLTTVDMSGLVQSTSGAGVDIDNTGNAATSVTLQDTGTIDAALEGIGINGIENITVTTDGNVLAGDTAIRIDQSGGTLTTVDMSGLVQSTSGAGVDIDNTGNAATSVTLQDSGTIDAALEGIGIDGIENITVTTDGDVFAGDTAIRIDQSGGTLTTVDMSGLVQSTSGAGVDIDNTGNAATSVTLQDSGTIDAALEGIGIDGIENITVTTDGDVFAGDTAIRIDQSGGTLTTVDMSGLVQSTSGAGVDIDNTGNAATSVTLQGTGTIDAALEGIGIDGIENITITTDGDVFAGDTAIRIDQSGGDNTQVLARGELTSTSGSGIDIDNTGNATTRVSLIAPGFIDAAAEGIGIDAIEDTVVSTSGDILAGDTGIRIDQSGGSLTSVSVSGAVESTGASGIDIDNTGNAVTSVIVQSGGTVDAAAEGIGIDGVNNVTVSASGAVTADDTAIRIGQSGGTSTQVLANAAITSTGGAGIDIDNTGNAFTSVTVTSAGSVDAAGEGIGIDSVNDTVVTTDGAVDAEDTAIRISQTGGAITQVTTNAAILSTAGAGIEIDSDVAEVTVDVNDTLDAEFDGINVESDAATSIDVSGALTSISGDGIEVAGGNGAVTIDVSALLDAGQAGIISQNDTGDQTITLSAGLTAADGDGIEAISTSGDVSVTTTAGGDIDASATGIEAISTDGAVSLMLAGDIDAGNSGIVAATEAGALTIDMAGTLDADQSGILADSTTGDQSITLRSALVANAGDGIASTTTDGDISITTTAAGTITSSLDGIEAQTGSGDVIILADGDIDAGEDGIDIAQSGDGVSTVTTNGAITAASDAITLSSTGNGPVTVTANDDIDAGLDGIDVDNLGTGATTILANGAIDAGDTAIESVAAGSVLDVTTNGLITGSTAMDLQMQGTGAVNVTVNEAVDMTDGGILVERTDAGLVDLDLNADLTTVSGDAINVTLAGASTFVADIAGDVSGAGGLIVSGPAAATSTITLGGTLTGTGGTALDAGDTELDLSAGGNITGDVLSGDGDTRMSFASGVTVDGDLLLGDGADLIDLDDTIITGRLSTAGGNDTVLLDFGTARIGSANPTDPDLDMGAGDDLLAFAGAGGQFDDVNRDGILDVREGGSNAPLFSGTGGAGSDTVTISDANTTAWAFEELSDFETLILSGTTFDTLGTGGSTTRTLDYDSIIIGAGSVILGDGASPMTTTTAGDLTNSGVGIDLRDQTMGTIDAMAGDGDDTFIISGDYIGDGGRIFLDVALDASGEAGDADRVVVQGDVRGTPTGIVVNDIGNGIGALTGPTGITLVETNGAAAPGDFFLDGGPIVTAGFLYTLDFTGTAFVLRSEVTGAGLQYPVLGVNIFDFNVDVLGTLAGRTATQQGYGSNSRVGEIEAMSFAEIERGTYGGAWLRAFGANSSQDGDVTGLPVTADYDSRYTALQAGYDFQLARSSDALTMGRVSIHGGRLDTDASGLNGVLRADGEASAIGLGLGVTHTTSGGFYVDSGIAYTSFDYDFDTIGGGTGDTDASGTAAKVEIGQRVEMGSYTLIPQAQLSAGRVDIDGFTDSNGIVVDFGSETFVEGRLGLRTEYAQGNGGLLYGGVDVIGTLSGETDVTVAGTALSYEEDGPSLKVTAGYRSDAAAGGTGFFGEVGYENGSDRQELSISGGLSLNF
ncbi:autotransporter outer membrane beta-barrel domain-containing protein, partial [Roseobacter sp. HKCCA0434]|uniref:beta strand repeat-containing protein n=1 Tax=Roseobacter sp. HKCCA0434 TaxID=3079297 RepID=UPI002905CA9B